MIPSAHPSTHPQECKHVSRMRTCSWNANMFLEHVSGMRTCSWHANMLLECEHVSGMIPCFWNATIFPERGHVSRMRTCFRIQTCGCDVRTFTHRIAPPSRGRSHSVSSHSGFSHSGSMFAFQYHFELIRVV